MAEQDVFNKKHADVVAKDERAILEELNLPPVVIEFLRKNMKNIKLGIIIFLVVVVAIEGYKKYTSVQTEKSSTLLYSALQSEDDTQKTTLLNQLKDKYSSTGSGIWANIELGHLAFKNGDFAKAASTFKAVLDKMSDDNPTYPLVQYSLAQAYENLDDVEKAKDAFLKLSQITGFVGKGDLGLARIYEKQDDPEQALTYYNEYVELPETQPGPTKDWVLAKIELLKK
jgi:predicted negative regulator of RcsB-dependent stress response